MAWRAVDEYWYYAYVPSQRRLDFQPYKVIFVVEPPVPSFVLRVYPLPADYYNYGFAMGKRSIEHFNKV